jgi:hypothetical protein
MASIDPAVTEVAVVGSCVSRDVFNSRFNPNYKDLFDCTVLGNQLSLISLMDAPFTLDEADIAELNEYDSRDARREAQKSLLGELVEAQPAYLILDFFSDAHFGCFSVDGHMFTRNRWKIMKASLYTKHETADLVPTLDPDAYFQLWTEAADRFLAFVHEKLPSTRVLLHSARNVTVRVDPDGSETPHGPTGELLDMNEWWNRLDQYVIKNHSPRVLDLFTPELRTFQEHPWGPFAVHYTLDYHARFLSKLTKIVVSDARSGTSLGPGRKSRRLFPWRH